MKHWDTEIFEYGLQNNRIVRITDVPNGLKCNCVCPNCKEKLVAVNNIKSKKLRPYFRHYSKISCEFKNYKETVVHYLAKEIIQKKGYIVIPKIEIQLSCYLSFYNTYIEKELENLPSINELPNYLIKKTTNYKLTIEKVELEKYEGQIKPDIIIVVNGKKLFIEIAYSHFVNEQKFRKIRENQLDVIEIDLSKLNKKSTENDIEKELYSSKSKIYWINNEKINEQLKQKITEAIEIRDFVWSNSKHIKTYANLTKVYNCPFQSKSSNKKHIEIKEECLFCDYYFDLMQVVNTDLEQYNFEKEELEYQGKDTTVLNEKYGKRINFKNGNLVCAGNLKNVIDKKITVANKGCKQCGGCDDFESAEPARGRP